ncbi:MAG: hypothetical protein Q8M16_07255 [Pirellulaceae bacterium]|nr:hypothetical protein [Pirellulaceae bacterium]
MATQTARKSDQTTNRETVVGVFHSHAEAQKAVRDLKGAGFTEEQIGIATQDRDGTFQEQAQGTEVSESATAGALGGLGIGALWGLGIVAGILPAIGPVIAGGALAAIVASAAGTAAAGGLIGALVGLGIPKDEAEYYENEFNNGRTVVTVKAGVGKFAQASRILDDSNSYDYDRRESDYASNAKSNQRVDFDRQTVDRREFFGVDTDHKSAHANWMDEEIVVERKDESRRARR